MNPSDLIDVFDEYLKRSGAGKNYIANKIFELFDSQDSPFNKDGKLINKLKENIDKLSDGFKNLDKKIKGFKLPSFTSLNKTLESTTKKVQNFRDNFKVPSFYGFNLAMSGALREVRKFRDNFKNYNKSLNGGFGSMGVESTLRNSKAVDVNLINIDKNAENVLTKVFSKIKIQNKFDSKKEDDRKGEGSFIGKIIKGIIGTVAVVAGIGFISNFLDTPIGKNIKAIIGDLKDRFVEMLKPFLKKILEYSVTGLKNVLYDLPKFLLKQTFNFFGLKEILGKENEGLALLLTKGLYYGMKRMFFKILDSVSFNSASKLVGYIKSVISGIGNIFSKIGDNLLKVLDFKSITKTATSVLKIGSGTIFKFLGKGIKTLAKRIPIIGAFLSFKDASDRFNSGDTVGGLISIGSGLASFFPGIGTAISIGLDVLNMLLDKKTEGGKTSKVTVLKDFFGTIIEKITEKLKDIFGNIIPFIEDAFKMLSDLAKSKFEDIKNAISDGAYEKGYDLASKFYNPNLKPPSAKEIEEFKESQKKLKTQKVQDGLLTNNKLIIPSTADDVVMAKNGGPFDLAFKEMNARLDNLMLVFAQGSQLIANSTIQGSSNVVQAVVSTGGKQAPIILGGNDPIADFRERANKSVR